MTATVKATVWIVIIAIVVGVIWWWYIAATVPGAYPTNSGTSSSGASNLTAGNSNANLNQDLATIDAQMSGFNSDSASINQSLNDQSVTQSQL